MISLVRFGIPRKFEKNPWVVVFGEFGRLFLGAAFEFLGEPQVSAEVDQR